MSTTLQFSTVKQLGAVLLAVGLVLAAGTVVGQAPEIFGADVEEEPEASVEFADQRGDGTGVTVDRVALSDGGFVAVSDESGEIVGVSGYLEAGVHENVTVEQRSDEDLEMLGQLTATVHADSPADEAFTYPETDGEEDLPYVDDGYPVTDTASVALAVDTDERESTTSFRVEGVDAPANATINETIDLNASVTNPNDAEMRQHVEVRLDGAVVERRVVTLGPNETRTLTFAIDLTDVEPGTHTYGVHTVDDGTLSDVTVERDGTASVSLVDSTPSNATVDATLPAGGFLAVETADGRVIGTSPTLEPGSHENVTVALDEPVDPPEQLAVVAYRGDANDLESAGPYLEDDARVADTTTIEDADNATDGE